MVVSNESVGCSWLVISAQDTMWAGCRPARCRCPPAVLASRWRVVVGNAGQALRSGVRCLAYGMFVVTPDYCLVVVVIADDAGDFPLVLNDFARCERRER